jgi:acyl carrier protein
VRRIDQTWVYLRDRHITPKEHVGLSARAEQVAPLPTRERTGYMSRKTVLLFPGQGAYRGRYATTLEYPVEVFTEDVELEADLGVDSVTQTELLSHAADRYQLPTRQTDFRLSDYSTIGRVADFVFGALTAPAA